MRKLSFFIPVILLFSACEKDISVDLPVEAPQLVVEGTFENGMYPQVILTHSLNYFSSITPDILAKAFVHNAAVTVTDAGNNVMTLKERVIDSANTKFYVYGPDFTGGSARFTGKVPGTYTLRINADNKAYESVTTIPSRGMRLDSIWWTLVQVDDSTKARLWVKITDAPAFGNYGRYFTRRNREPFLPGRNSVVDDQLVNGTTFEIPVDAGVDKNKKPDVSTDAFFELGDTVTLKFCNIDKATWDFWRTLDFAYNSNGNPFSSPTKILGNVSGGALGYWGGYTVSYKTIIISR
ncbi:DUF4249 domain-containing protein [Chitinophaga arvensicola]|uniref:DUF4249 domain-containing protein n=1 Tax=Chitinophaga arvensicola TaxID=29529 RepID=A0A1I0SAW2_9BACT|nr:DUF4249 domain-containing protein [Chitinophaga arvensicola]SEW53595.1 protein of unknown function [Chitinophaga arvensicola]